MPASRVSFFHPLRNLLRLTFSFRSSVFVASCHFYVSILSANISRVVEFIFYRDEGVYGTPRWYLYDGIVKIYYVIFIMKSYYDNFDVRSCCSDLMELRSFTRDGTIEISKWEAFSFGNGEDCILLVIRIL